MHKGSFAREEMILVQKPSLSWNEELLKVWIHYGVVGMLPFRWLLDTFTNAKEVS